MYKELKRLQEFVDKMKSTSSLNEKKEIIKTIKDDSFITKVLHYTYNPYFKYHVTSKNCKKNSDLVDQSLCSNDGTIFDLLDVLRNREFTGHDAISQVNGFVEFYKDHADLIYNILDRNIELRASDSVINKVIPNLIPALNNSVNILPLGVPRTSTVPTKFLPSQCISVIL